MHSVYIQCPQNKKQISTIGNLKKKLPKLLVPGLLLQGTLLSFCLQIYPLFKSELSKVLLNDEDFVTLIIAIYIYWHYDLNFSPGWRS